MSGYQFNSNFKNLSFGESEVSGTCFQELSLKTINKGNSQTRLSTFETSSYLALRFEELDHLLLNLNFSESIVSFIYQKTQTQPTSTDPLMNSQNFKFCDFNFSRNQSFEIQSQEPSDFIFLLIRESDFRTFLNSNIVGHQEIIANLNFEKDWLFPKNFNASFVVRHLLNTLFEANAENPFAHLLFQSKILEIFAKTFEIIQQDSTQTGPENCTWTRLKPLIAAKKIIEENLASPPSLGKISKMVGINEYDLKKGFKEQFGSTVFGYLGEQRMSLAYELLKNNSQTIGEISSIVGYKNPQHFSSAFKKRFGLNPSQVMD